MVASSILVTVLILIKGIPSNALISNIKLPMPQYNNENISKCIITILKKEIPSKSVVSVVSSNDYLLRSINTYFHYTVIARKFDDQERSLYSDAYLISVNNKPDFLTGMLKLSKDSVWNPTAKFIIIFKNMIDDRNEILEVFNMLLKKSIINVVVIKVSKTNNLELLTYYPYEGSNCGQNANDIRSFGLCGNLNDMSLFPDKLPNGLRNCTILAAARECSPYVINENGNNTKYLDVGIEQYVFNIIAKYEGFNFKVTFIEPNQAFGVVLPNKTITGLLGYLQNDKVSVVLGGMFLLKNRMEVFDFIYGYSYALFGIFTPVLPEQKWTRVYRQFGFTTWMLIIISFVFTTIIILKTLSITSGKPKDKLLIVLKLWRYFYGQVDDNLFRHKHLKRIMIVWIIFTNSVSAFYNTALYSLITGHVQKQITIDPNNLASLPFTPCISDGVRTFFKYAYNQKFPEGDNSIACQKSDAAFEGVGTRTDLYTIDTDYAYFMTGSKYEDAEGRPTIKKWDFPRNLVFTVYMTKGFPLRHAFQKRALDIYERGLLQRHLANVLARKPKPVLILQRKHSTIKLEDFVIHFLILILGFVASFISFLIELRNGKKKIL